MLIGNVQVFLSQELSALYPFLVPVLHLVLNNCLPSPRNESCIAFRAASAACTQLPWCTCCCHNSVAYSEPKTAVRAKFHLMWKFQTDTRSRYFHHKSSYDSPFSVVYAVTLSPQATVNETKESDTVYPRIISLPQAFNSVLVKSKFLFFTPLSQPHCWPRLCQSELSKTTRFPLTPKVAKLVETPY